MSGWTRPTQPPVPPEFCDVCGHQKIGHGLCAFDVTPFEPQRMTATSRRHAVLMEGGDGDTSGRFYVGGSHQSWRYYQTGESR